MAFAETRFPPDIAYGSAGGPEYSTDIVMTYSGYEQRNSNWAAARARFNVAHGVKTKAQLDELIAFFRARRGRAEGFRFKDWSDYQATAQNIGIGNGTLTSFQLKKTYTSGSSSEERIITKPVSGTIAIFKAGVLQTSGVSVNAATGIVTFTTAPTTGQAITADFEFDIPARFDTDRLSASLDTYGSYSWSSVPIIEVRI